MAPLRVPVELRGSQRFWRMAHFVAPDGIELRVAAPAELEGAIEIAFHLPGDAETIRCHARAEEKRVRFLDLDATARTRIERYVKERLLIE
jgi:hypothetical protein